MAENRQPNPGRKPIRRRYGESGEGFGAIPEFGSTEENWRRLEGALGAHLSSSVRDELGKIIHKYAWWSSAAKAAPFADDVERELADVRTAALELKNQLANMTSPAAKTAKSVLRRSFKKRRSYEPDVINKIDSILSDMAYCCKMEISASQSRGDMFDEFEEWDKMIAKIIDLFEKKGLPTGISASHTISDSPKVSRFVAFIAEIQSILPADATKRGEHSPGALAKAMQRARDADKDRRRQAEQAERPEKTEAVD